MRFQYFALAALLLVSACNTGGNSQTVTVLDGTQIHTLQTNHRGPLDLLLQAGVILGPNDKVLLNGTRISLDQAAPQTDSVTLEIRRALTLTILTPDGQPRTLQTTARTVGDALQEAGIPLHVGDHVDPTPETAITGPLTVTFTPSREVTITTGGSVVSVFTSAGSVGEALAEAGMPLLGLDYSLPSENEALPADGQIRIVQVRESVVFSQKPIAFESEFQASAEVELDQQQVLQPGQPGLTVSRVRVRYEDGQEVSRLTESETTVRPPQKRIVGYGTQVVVKTAVVDGVAIEYWRAVQMFATSYSPCRSAADRCYPGTSSGKPVKKGVTAVVHRWYVYMQGQPVYIPGYGHATIEDVGGGIPGRYWIDLGYSDADYEQWGEWVTVYFLTPVPQNIIFVLE
jgi:resuscitation-promoting factor RpfB